MKQALSKNMNLSTQSEEFGAYQQFTGTGGSPRSAHTSRKMAIEWQAHKGSLP